MTAVVGFIIHEWGIPWMGTRHLLPAILEGNTASLKVFEKNGFSLWKTVPDSIFMPAKGDIPAAYYAVHYLEWKATQ